MRRRRRSDSARAIEHVDLCIVGGGPAGLAAARACAETAARAHVVLFDEQAALGGSLLAAPGGRARGEEMAAAARRAGARLESDATAIAFFPEDGERRATAATRGTPRACSRS